VLGWKPFSIYSFFDTQNDNPRKYWLIVFMDP
jgi:hypothetical protein